MSAGGKRFAVWRYTRMALRLSEALQRQVKTHSNLHRQINIAKSFSAALVGSRQRTKFITTCERMHPAGTEACPLISNFTRISVALASAGIKKVRVLRKSTEC